MFLGENDDLTGLDIEVTLNKQVFRIKSPASVFIPLGVYHSYKVIGGGGCFINHVLADNYNDRSRDTRNGYSSASDQGS
ncbi:hypothetical protein [Facilibium subflavum]|uniref:hypothetical protein n=1 Tax=Facilibium subflavum TaxID=2219058 RepID=UPI000E65704A|nr:hypothetical protein [Facilibium subflavum]